MEKEKRIVVDFKIKKELLKFGSYPTIRLALDGEVNTPQKITIRSEAIKLGGVIMEPKDNKPTENEISNISSNCTPFI